jgi:hypothetical protein
MERRLFDAINCSNSTSYTKIPNDLLRNKNISGKAKAILCLLLSNSKGWQSYMTTLKKMMKESDEALLSGLKELEKYGYFKKYIYRDIQTKRTKGSFWAYADEPNTLNISENLEYLKKNNLELFIQPQKPDTEKPVSGKPVSGFNGTKNTNIKKQQYSISEEIESTPPPFLKKDKNKEYYPLAEDLAKTISTKKNIKITPSKIEFWAKDIRKLIEADGVDSPRVKKTLDWYENHIGEQYIPIIESGKSLREKFIRLENAMENNGYNTSGFVPKSKPKYAAARTSKLKSIPDIIINNTTNEWKKTI